jgi:hypothetical protein
VPQWAAWAVIRKVYVWILLCVPLPITVLDIRHSSGTSLSPSETRCGSLPQHGAVHLGSVRGSFGVCQYASH